MRWLDGIVARPMRRVAIVAPGDDRVRRVLVAVAQAGTVEIDAPAGAGTAGAASAAAEEWARRGAVSGPVDGPTMALCPDRPDVAALVRDGRLAELLGEAELERVRGAMVERGPLAAIAGWCPAAAIGELAAELSGQGAAVVPIQARPGLVVPTSLTDERLVGAFQPLVDTYGTVPYADVNPSVFAGLSYIVMFGMMFGDVGHGLLLITLGLLARAGKPALMQRMRRFYPFVLGAGVASVVFGALYGEAFGPTGLVPVLWLRPLNHATTLLAVAAGIGAALLGVSYGFGVVNRWRESGPTAALVALSGLAGAALYLGLASAAAGWYLHLDGVVWLGGALILGGLTSGFVGGLRSAEPGPGRLLQPTVEVFDATLRIGSNAVSFTRLAAFGLTHAALGGLVWSATVALAAKGPVGWAAGVALFALGNAAAFSLEGLVAGIQALRLEYYEMFSRIFTVEGKPFRPWRIPLAGDATPPGCRPVPLPAPSFEEAPC